MRVFFNVKRVSLATSLLLLLGVYGTSHSQEMAKDELNCDGSMSWRPSSDQAESGNQEFAELCSKGLLEMQRSGEKSSEYQQKLPAVVLDDILERYENSFTHPIPEYFVSTEFSSSE